MGMVHVVIAANLSPLLHQCRAIQIGAPFTEPAATELYHSVVISEGCRMREYGSRRTCLISAPPPPAWDCSESND